MGCLVAGDGVSAAVASRVSASCFARISSDDKTISLSSSSDHSAGPMGGAGETGRDGSHLRESGVGDLLLAPRFCSRVGATPLWETLAVGLTERLFGGAMSSEG